MLAGKVGPGSYLAPGLKGPAFGTGLGIHAVEHAVLVAGIDSAIPDADRGLDRAGLVLPLFLAVRQVQSVEMLVHTADIHRIADDGRRSLDAFLELDLPADLKRIGQGTAGGDPRLLGIAAKDGPVGLSQTHRDEDCREGENVSHDYSLRLAAANRNTVHNAARYKDSRSPSATGRGLKRAVHCCAASSARTGRMPSLTPHSPRVVGKPAVPIKAMIRWASNSAALAKPFASGSMKP